MVTEHEWSLFTARSNKVGQALSTERGIRAGSNSMVLLGFMLTQRLFAFRRLAASACYEGGCFGSLGWRSLYQV